MMMPLTMSSQNVIHLMRLLNAGLPSAVCLNVMHSQAPFHLTRRGWGEFLVRVQLHF